jgi:hypothetical protein
MAKATRITATWAGSDLFIRSSEFNARYPMLRYASVRIAPVKFWELCY